MSSGAAKFEKPKIISAPVNDYVLQYGFREADVAKVLGEYQCFVKENWARGLPLLAQGSDEDAAALVIGQAP